MTTRCEILLPLNGFAERATVFRACALTLIACVAFALVACAAPHAPLIDHTSALASSPLTQRQQPTGQGDENQAGATQPGADGQGEQGEQSSPTISIIEDYRESLVHGDKGPAFQKYIVLHDTEGEGSPASVIDWWDSNGNLVAAHFVIGRDGSVYQCVPLDNIAHHAGYGNAGHNDAYEVAEDGRDDMLGSTRIGSWAPDYGMNAWSVGIEMVHISGSGDYPKEQLNALDALIAHIDAYYGFESTIIDHKAWRSGNSDTSPEFSEYLYNYQDHRRHTP
jgi:hypothetical protein